MNWLVLAILAVLRLPLVVHVTSVGGAPVADDATVRRFVAKVNGLYREAGVCFGLREIRPLARDGELKTYRDRRILGNFVVARAINVFVVDSILDPEPSESTKRAAARAGFVPGRWLNGAEIDAPRLKPSIYLIVKIGAGPKTLAHELGHFLGEGHHHDPSNLMSYGEDRSRFDAGQMRDVRARASQLLHDGTLVPVDKCD